MYRYYCGPRSDPRPFALPPPPRRGVTSIAVFNESAGRLAAREQRSRSLYRICAVALIAAAILLALSLLTAGGVLPQDLPELRAAAGRAQVALLWLATLAPPLVAGALLAIARHFRGTSREGWALLAVATNAVGGTLLVLAFALGAVAAPALADAARGADVPGAGPSALAPVALVAASARAVGGMLFWLSLLPLSVALARDRLWPRPLAWGAGVVAVAEVVLPPALPFAEPLVRLAGCLYLALLGLAALRVIGILRVAAAEAARADDEEA